MNNIKLSPTIDAMSKWIVGIAVGFVTYSVNEIRSDVKQLMATSNINSTKIENIETRVSSLEQITIYDKLKTSKSNNTNFLDLQRIVFVKKDDEDDGSKKDRIKI